MAQRRAEFVFRRFLSRPPTDKELVALVDYQRAQFKRLATGELKAAEIVDGKGATPELASWVLVVRAVMNLDEAITKQ